MTLSSMTGFARATGEHDSDSWTWELKSVNGRGLDLRFRFPAGYEYLETPLRAVAVEHLSRGNVSISLQSDRTVDSAGIQINHAILDTLLETVARIDGAPGTAPAQIDGLLAIRGVVEPLRDALDEANQSARDVLITSSFLVAIQGLAAFRADEGRALAGLLSGNLDEAETLINAADAAAGERDSGIAERVRERVNAALEESPALPEDRLAQEVAILIVKGDVTEELDRLRAHTESFRGLLSDGGVNGRRLDFLCQELNREASTLCSKANDGELVKIGLELKVLIDRMREQVQNIE